MEPRPPTIEANLEANGSLRIRLVGTWLLDRGAPTFDNFAPVLAKSKSITRAVYDASALAAWDSAALSSWFTPVRHFRDELSASSTDRWGEPLNTGVARVLAEDLSTSRKSDEVVSFPWSKKMQVEYIVRVEFVKLEQTADGRAICRANWIICRGSDGAILQRGATSDDRPTGSNQRSATEALSMGIGHVSNDVAEALMTSSRFPGSAKE